ncbi:hypothetical protein [Bdellovibrio sp. KM01]|uniref:hypothetical protein n=1 Tax=Bdellovibrio sp. KM01 TaxID=2748865 RepID=UPI0015EABED7|nr:hypothetical protein [Bdellovibrio sp. KM01]QLY24346.1 hypothetical protein HW988_12840 [Bdellovibrio sp. KM01]
MKHLKHFLIFVLLSCFFGSFANSAEEQILSPRAHLEGKPYPNFTHKENESEAPHREWEWSLPIFAQRVIDKGFNLPRPYGLSLIYGQLSQGFNIENLKVAFDGSSDLTPVDFINFSNTQINNTTWQLKLDAWLFPFLNLFGILGYIHGDGSVPLNIAYKDIYNMVLPGNPCNVGSPPAFCQGYINAVAPINFHGYSLGIGIILAGGYKDWFFAMPATYVESDVNVSDTNPRAINITPRIGYNIKTESHGKFGVYLGLNYFNSDVTLSGTYTLPLSGTSIGRDVPVRYSLKETPLDNWNAVGGVNWELSEFWSIVMEIGHSQNRDTTTFNFAYRF